MTNQEFINFSKELGHRIIQTRSCHWIFRDNSYALSFPTLDTVFPTQEELSDVFNNNINFLLFKTDIKQHNSAEYLFEGNNYGLEVFDSKIRNQIRKGLKTCVVKNADLDSMKKRGLEINQQTLGKHNRNVSYLGNRLEWENYISKHYHQPDVFIKGAYVDDTLVAYVIFVKVAERYIIFHPFMDMNYSSSNPMNALLYSFINEVISRERQISISYGLASFSEKVGLDKFKKGMLFYEKPVTRVPVVKPIYKLFINNFTKILLQSLIRMELATKSKLDVLDYLIRSKKLPEAYYEYLNMNRKNNDYSTL